MATKIEVNLDSLAKNIESMKDVLKAIGGNMKKMSSDVDSMSQMWDGPAHDAFVDQFGLDEKDFGELQKAISEYLGTLEDARETYLKYEARITEIISNMK